MTFMPQTFLNEVCIKQFSLEKSNNSYAINFNVMVQVEIDLDLELLIFNKSD